MERVVKKGGTGSENYCNIGWAKTSGYKASTSESVAREWFPKSSTVPLSRENHRCFSKLSRPQMGDVFDLKKFYTFPF